MQNHRQYTARRESTFYRPVKMIGAMLAKLTPEQRLHFLRIFLPYLDNAQGQADVNLPQSAE
jgi:hypothetical protein